MIRERKMDSISALWNDLSHRRSYPAHHRVSSDHPLDLYAEISSDGRPGLMAISPRQPSVPPKYDSVEVEIGHRADGKWTVRILLLRPELRVPFAYLCDDIIRAGRSITPGCDPGNFVLTRLDRWRRLLSPGRDRILSEQEIRGLLGELLFLRACVPVYGSLTTVRGWNGPFDAPIDFELPDKLYEIKTVRAGAVTVRISSLDQLDAAEGTINLVVYELTASNRGPVEGGVTLAGLVGELRSVFEDQSEALGEFEQRLKAGGYEDRDEYLAEQFLPGRPSFFSVSEAFPRLVRSQLPHAFADAKYELFLADCEAFRAGSPLT